MASFEEREKGEEARFAHDERLKFRAEARRNKHLAHWACDKMGTEGVDDKANYVAEVIAADMVEGGFEDVVRKIKTDFDAKGVAIAEGEIRTKVHEFEQRARQEILSELS